MLLYTFTSLLTGLLLATEINASGNDSHRLSSTMAQTLSSRSIIFAPNPKVYVRNGVWLGKGGPYTVDFINKSGQELGVVIWGASGNNSFVNLVTPLITVGISVNSSMTISFDYGATGAWSGIYSDTPDGYGLIADTWGEFAFGSASMYDVSRQLNMNGHNMSIQGPTCKADMNTCVFVCDEGEACAFGYRLRNCATGSQKGAASYGRSSGGCTLPKTQGGSLVAIFS